MLEERWQEVQTHTIPTIGPISCTEQPLQTFAISQERYSRLHEGEVVQIKYSAHVHYVFALEPLEHE